MYANHAKNAVIFGGAGFVGRYLVRKLAQQNWNVSVVTRRPHRHRELLVMPTVKIEEISRLNPDSIRTLLKENDTVINLVGILNETKSQTFDAIHADFPAEIAKIGIEKNIRRLVHISSIGADTNAPSRYLQTKGQGELALFDARREGLEFDILRPSIVFGPEDSFTQLFAKLLKLAKGVFFVISPDSRMQPVYVEELVSCIAHAVNQQHGSCRSFDVAGPEIFTFFELIGLIDKLSGGRHRLIRLNDFLSRTMATLMQFAPGQLLTPDNILSLQVPNIIQTKQPHPYGAQSRRFEDTAISWLQPQKQRMDTYRTQAGR